MGAVKEMTENGVLRLAEPADAALLTALRMEMLREVAEEIPPHLPQAILQYLQNGLRDGSCLCAILEKDGSPAATAMLCLAQSVPDECNATGRYALLSSVYTLPQYRGNGFMEALLRWLLARGREAGVREVFLGAERKAIPLYERLGFVLTETEMYLPLDPL